MKYILSLLLLAITQIQTAAADTGILGGQGVTQERIRRGDLHLSDMGNILTHAINWVIGFAGTIAVIAVIFGAYKIMIGSVSEGDTKQGKEYIVNALIGFGLAALAWFIVKLIIDNFS